MHDVRCSERMAMDVPRAFTTQELRDVARASAAEREEQTYPFPHELTT